MAIRTHITRIAAGLACAAAALGSASASASAAGVWSPTGDAPFTLTTGHTATALPGGGLMLAGGFSDVRGSVSSTAIWKPATEEFEPGGCFGDRRGSPITAALADGRVLVAGGLCDVVVQTAVRTAEIYDPQTGAYAPTGAMVEVRSSPVSTLLGDGRVLIVSGDTAEVYDPNATDPATGLRGRFTTAGFLHVPVRAGMSLTTLADGRALLVGGESGGPFTTSNVELFDPLTATWTQTGKLIESRKSHVAALLPNGKVLVAGGLHVNLDFSQKYLSSSELYDPVTGTWSATGAMSVARNGAAGLTLLDGRVLAAGGRSQSQSEQSSETYSPATGTWTPTAGSPLADRIFGGALRLADGRVLVTGGFSAPPDIFDPLTGTWSAPSAAPFPPGGATLLPNGKVFCRGDVFSFHRANELYDPLADTWTQSGMPNDNRRGHTATLLGNGTVLFAGGIRGDNTTVASAELFDPATGFTAPAGALTTARSGATATRLLDGRVLVAAGLDGDGQPLESAELFDPATRTWSAAGTLGARSGHSASLLADGHVLVVGGVDKAGDPLDSVELYDPQSNSWSAVAPMHVARRRFATATLPDGRVLVAGGQDAGGDALASVEIYGPDNTWRLGHAMQTARFGAAANVLAGGRVLVSGGASAPDSSLRSTEIYDVLTDSWSAGEAMTRGRLGHLATTLADGRVLALSGFYYVRAFGEDWDATAEVYDPGAEPRGSFLPTGAPRYPDWWSQTLLANGKVLALGGGATQQRAELFNPLSERWSPAASMLAAHPGGRVVVLADGRLLVAAGGKAAEIYDPHTNTWALTGSLGTERFGPAAARLGDGRVLIVGGDGFISQTTEIYDPVAGVWTAGPDSAIWRGDQANAIELRPPGCGTQCGQVLLVGGPNPRTNQLLELFDPATNTFSSPGHLSASRGGANLMRLLDGRVLIADGSTDEIYDPAQPNTLGTGFPRFSHLTATTALLPDGQVLWPGGERILLALPNAEVYHPASGRWSVTGTLRTPRANAMTTSLAAGPYSACGRNCGKVLVGGGTEGTANNNFGIQTTELFTAHPEITGIDITTGDVAGGTRLTITGHALASVSRVSFGASNAVSFVPDEQTPDTKLAVIVPPHASGVVDVRVANPGGTSDVTAAARYRYTSAVSAAQAPATTPPAGTPAPAAGTPAVDTTRPVVRNLRASPPRFTAGPGLARLGRATTTGTTISFSLSERAATRLAFTRLLPGRRVGTSCRTETRRLRARPRCTRTVAVTPAVRIAARPAGVVRVRFEGRLSRARSLTRGSYRLTVVATDAAGNRSLPKTVELTLVRRR